MESSTAPCDDRDERAIGVAFGRVLLLHQDQRLCGQAEDGAFALRARFTAVNEVHSGENGVLTRDDGRRAAAYLDIRHVKNALLPSK